MDRRTFLKVTAGVAAGAQDPLAPAAEKKPLSETRPKRKVVVACIDGLDPDYLSQSDVPNLKRLMKTGFYMEGKAVIPTVTNVNNASIATASFPEEHGITGNYYFDRSTGKGSYMESADFLRRATLFEKAKEMGVRSALVTSKEKLKKLLWRGTHLAVSAENPPAGLVAEVGPGKDIYSPDINYWTIRAAAHLLNKKEFDFVYLATTDYMMHTYPPKDPRSQAHLHHLDRLLGEMVSAHSRLELYLTADHGMSAKTQAIDIGRLLREKGIAAEAIPIIKDRYIAHHKNLGGACYVYLSRTQDSEKAHEVLRMIDGVTEVYPRDKAAKQFRLARDRIGDFFLLGEQHVAFGDLAARV